MRAVVQRVSRAKVTVDDKLIGEIGVGLLVLLGVTHADDNKDAEYLVDKIINLRVFDDTDGKMNLSLADIDGELLVVSQFTLYGDTRRGRRPSFIKAVGGDDALRWYKHFVVKARENVKHVATGEFGAMMDVELVNDGPVTILLDSEKTI
ncbi:MAG: D-tyrosyl-tRNA(Tyr) deacylase [Pyrinomonadaceae bacterium]|nr:D-tyrosyl-tRNA(Tyr) deacylase [Acidobacteriota bacterium]MBP7377945.1 D-tyrosyl-tRNA(Tyr) deacylase [Pyrinomonadaceae bacterium]